MRSQDHDRIYLSPPHLGRHELNYLHKAIEDNWVAPVGPNITGFEQDICQYTGAGHCVALNSGTAAIHLGLLALGVGPGDEVLCSSFTFVASANPIIYVGATPVFVDSEAETWNMDPARLREAIEDRQRQGHKPKALVLVHLYGMPAKMRELMAIAEEFSIPVLEDSAEGLGSLYHGQALGTFGAVGVFSFNGNKILTTSGGGVLITPHKDIATQTLFLATQAREAAAHYQHETTGYNYRLSNLLAGIGRGQMGLIEDRVKKRREIFAWYQKHLHGIPGLSVGPTEPAKSRSNRWLTTVLLDPEQTSVTPEQLRQHLETHNVESRPLWKPLHLQPLFANAPMYGGEVSTRLFQQGLCLPSGSAMTDTDLRRVVDGIRELFPA